MFYFAPTPSSELMQYQNKLYFYLYTFKISKNTIVFLSGSQVLDKNKQQFDTLHTKIKDINNN